MTSRTTIDAAELIAVRRSDDRTHVRLTLRDKAGQNISLSLPVNCLNAVVSAMPQQIERGSLHTLDTWSIEPTPNGQDVVLTLRAPDGLAVSFAAKPWQVEGMATVATYGRGNRLPAKSIH